MSPTVRNGAADLDRDAIDYAAIQDPGHGNTPAAWAGVFIMLIGITVATVGNVIDMTVLIWVGGAVAVLGLVVGFIMRKAGKGKQRR